MRLAIMGAGGRMGQELIRTIHESPHCGVAGAVERPESPLIGKDAGEVAGAQQEFGAAGQQFEDFDEVDR